MGLWREMGPNPMMELISSGSPTKVLNQQSPEAQPLFTHRTPQCLWVDDGRVTSRHKICVTRRIPMYEWPEWRFEWMVIVHYLLCVLATVEWSAPDYASTWTYSHPLTDQIPIKKHELLLIKSETVCEFRWGFWEDSGGWRECIQWIRVIDYIRECPPNLDAHSI